MIASVDGATAVAGLSGGLGNDGDRAAFRAIRQAADVVIVGASTAADEGYRTPGKPGLRIGVVTNSARLDWDGELFTSGTGFVVAPESARVPHGVDVLRCGRSAVDLTLALARIGEVVPNVAFVSAEGGPRLNGALIASELVDEVALTTSARLVAGDSPRLVVGAPEVGQPLELAHLLIDDDHYLYARWVRRAA